MRIVINQDQDTVIASLKSVDGVKIARKPVFFYQGRKGMREYILRESWLKAVRIRTKQVRDVKTSVDFKLVRTNRLQEVVFLLTFASVIFMMATVASGWKLWIPPPFTFLFPFCLYFVPYLFFKPFVSEISSFLLERQSAASRLEE
tara:strand:+ start:640 stop:1077 length:438 start_codon:yes stop_codon:yes gene_type:complete